MALFKEENCAYCGKKLSLLGKHKLADGTPVCGKHLRCDQGNS